MDQPTATIIAASLVFVGTFAGFVGGLVVARATYRQKSDELFFKALDFLGGGSQKRNLGIAAIELYWSNRRHRPVSVSLLIGSALYLLSESKQDDASHELHNLERIMTHLLRRESRAATSSKQYERLLAALETAQKPGRTTGLAIPAPQLSEWKETVQLLVTAQTKR
ncbi:MAG: hypothetical protein ABL984_14105 [Pyrinomonadaceae bacterium]